MAVRNLAISVTFAALDRLSAPLRRLTQGAKALDSATAETTRRLAALKRTQSQIGGYKGAETRFKETAAALDQARAKTAALKAQLDATENPTKKLAAAFAKADAAEKQLTERHEKQGQALEQLARGLNGAGVDVGRLAEHEQRLGHQIYDTSKQLDQQRTRLERLNRLRERGARLKEIGGNVTAAGAVATATVSAPIVALFGSSVAAAKESAQSTAQARQAIASMGPAAGRTLPQLQAFASKLQDITLYDDDDILKKVTANMLTFGNIAGTNFDRAQIAAVNLSARLGQDLQSSTIQVGKALNDPVKGITALRRVGIQFSEDQQKTINRLVETGQVAKAQTIILNELGREFGGAANAARKADPGGALTVQWRNFQEAIGGVLLNYLPPLLEQLSRLLSTFNNLDGGSQTAVIALLALAAAIGPIVTVVGGALTAIGAVAAGLGVGFIAAGAIVVGAVAAIAVAAYLLYTYWGPITGFFGSLWAGITARFQAGLDWLRSLIPSWGQIGKFMLQALLNALDPLAVARHVIGLGGTLVTSIKGVLGIKSPSRVFAGIGGNIMAGLAQGLDRAGAGPVASLQRQANRLTGALAASSLAVSPAGALAAPTAAGAGGGQAVSVARRTTIINIYAQPGQDPDAIARAVDERLAARDRADEARQRASYRDDA